MTTAPLRVLLIEDCDTDALLIVRELRRLRRGLEHERIETEAGMRRALAGSRWDIIVSDWSLPTFGAEQALATLKSIGTDIPFIIVSGTVNEELAVEAMRAGASDFLSKDKLARLIPAVERELRERDSRALLAQTEEQLRHAQKMEAIGVLAGGVAHDFNNLLSVILSYGSLVHGALLEADPLRADVEEICAAAERAAGLTRQLLAFGRRQVLKPRLVTLESIVLGMQRLLCRLLGEDVDLRLSLASSPQKVLVDPGQIEQVVMNLAVNARDAMPAGGRLSIETSRRDVDEAFAAAHVGMRKGPHVVLAVSDNGTGMDAATRARIFEPFFTTKGVGKGTGLGLSTVHGIVQQSGGTIWVESEPGGGTRFEIHFPIATSDCPSAEPPTMGAAVAGGGSETILVVEDDAPLRGVIARILEDLGYQVLVAETGGDALLIGEQLSQPIDLLLTDVVMPRLSGPQLASRLRAARPELQVIFMSGYAGDAVVNHGLLGGDQRYLQKPITPDGLAIAVRSALDARGVRSAEG